MCWSSSDCDCRWVCISTDVFSPRIRVFVNWCSRLPGTERLSAGETAHGLEPSCTEPNRASWHKWKRPRPLDPNWSCCRAERRRGGERHRTGRKETHSNQRRGWRWPLVQRDDEQLLLGGCRWWWRLDRELTMLLITTMWNSNWKVVNTSLPPQ